MRKLVNLNDMAAEIEARIADLDLEKTAVPRAERRPINQQIHTLRNLLDWCKTRADYVESVQSR